MKLYIKYADEFGSLLIVDERGKPVSGQQRIEIDQEPNELPTATVKFVIGPTGLGLLSSGEGDDLE